MKHTKQLILSTFLLLLISGCGGASSSLTPSSSSEAPISEIPSYSYEIEDISNSEGSVYYEVFVRSFVDSDGDKVGDLYGLDRRIPYLADLGVSGLWLMPINPSPSYHGYDVTDYKAIQSSYGTMTDFDNLVTRASEYNIDIILDLVLNHSSSSHPWFTTGFNNYKNGNCAIANSYCDYYNFSGSGASATYEQRFSSSMPDLNLDSENVRNEIIDIVEFWLNKGVKGFRLDAVSYLYYNQRQKNIDFLTWFNGIVKNIRPDAYIVGEAWIEYQTELMTYYEAGVDSYFNFPGAKNTGRFVANVNTSNGAGLATFIESTTNQIKATNADGFDAPFLSNHDMDRSGTWFTTNREMRQKAAASAYLLAPGRPFIYYGEEIGLKGSRGDAQTDANRRLPMIWSETNKAGETKPPVGYTYDLNNQVKRGAFDLIDEDFSLTNHYKKVISLRNKYPLMERSAVEKMTFESTALLGLHYLGTEDLSDDIYVVTNLSNEVVTFETEFAIIDEVNTNQIKATLLNDVLTLQPFSTVILK